MSGEVAAAASRPLRGGARLMLRQRATVRMQAAGRAAEPARGGWAWASGPRRTQAPGSWPSRQLQRVRSPWGAWGAGLGPCERSAGGWGSRWCPSVLSAATRLADEQQGALGPSTHNMRAGRRLLPAATDPPSSAQQPLVRSLSRISDQGDCPHCGRWRQPRRSPRLRKLAARAALRCSSGSGAAWRPHTRCRQGLEHCRAACGSRDWRRRGCRRRCRRRRVTACPPACCPMLQDLLDADKPGAPPRGPSLKLLGLG